MNNDSSKSGRSSGDKKGKKKKRNNNAAGIENASAAVATLARDVNEKMNKSAARNTAAPSVPGAVSSSHEVDTIEPDATSSAQGASAGPPLSPSPSDSQAKNRARRTTQGTTTIPGAIREDLVNYPDATAAIDSLEADLQAKHQARPSRSSTAAGSLGAVSTVGGSQTSIKSSGRSAQRNRTSQHQARSLTDQSAGSDAVAAASTNRASLRDEGEVKLPHENSRRRQSADSNVKPGSPSHGLPENNNDYQDNSDNFADFAESPSKDFDIMNDDSKDLGNNGTMVESDHMIDQSQASPREAPLVGGRQLAANALDSNDMFNDSSSRGGSGGIQAFVAEQQVVDAMGVAVLQSDEEIERLEEKKFRRYLCLGIVALIVLVIAIVVPVVVVAQKKRRPASPPTLAPTGVPSFSPSSTRLVDMIEFASSISGPENLQDETSPQYLAAAWVADEDETQPAMGSLELTQRYVLAVYYFSTGGDTWTDCNRFAPYCRDGFAWLQSTESECFWHGVRCTDNIVDRILLGQPQTLSQNGTLPSELAMLTDITVLSMINGDITGPIPSELGLLTLLNTIWFQDQALTGMIPEELISGAIALDMLALGGNQLSGPIPTSLGTLPLLRDLQLFGNAFTGSIPTELGSLALSLRNLELNSNLLTGRIPDSLYNLVLLSVLRLDENDLSGTISPLLGGMTSLQTIQVGGNRISGNLPTSIYSIPALGTIGISDNIMSGTLSESLILLNATLEEFVASNNNLSGPLPQALNFLIVLQTLFLHQTDVTGTVSPSVCNRAENVTMPTTVVCSCCDSAS